MELDGQPYCLVCFLELRCADEYGSALGAGGTGGMATIVLPLSELETLLEYSKTLPTGTTIGKRWKRRTAHGWTIGQYQAHPDPDQVTIAWQRVVLLESLGALAVWGVLLAVRDLWFMFAPE
jgi:hypothetical protein